MSLFWQAFSAWLNLGFEVLRVESCLTPFLKRIVVLKKSSIYKASPGCLSPVASTVTHMLSLEEVPSQPDVLMCAGSRVKE